MDNYLLFLMMSFLLIILPGPDSGLVIQNTIAYGKTSGIKTVFGSVLGVLTHTLAVILGLSAIIVKSAFVFSIMKYIGAIYLIYLGIMSLKTLKNSSKIEQTELTQCKHKDKNSFLQGYITCVSNPKVAVFFLTFLPQFIDPNGNHLLQFIIMGISFAVITIIWFFVYVYLINYLSIYMKKRAVQNAIQGITGVVLLGFGIKLALEKQP